MKCVYNYSKIMIAHSYVMIPVAVKDGLTMSYQQEHFDMYAYKMINTLNKDKNSMSSVQGK